MKQIFYPLLFLLCMLSVSCTSYSIEKQIASKVLPLKDACDFSKLNDILKDKRIVILGEASHYDGTSFEIRSKLVKYMCQYLGFQVLGLETFGFTVSNVFYSPLSSVPAFDINPNWSPLWVNTVECQPLIKAINEGEIEVFGFDVDNNNNEITIDCLQQLVERWNPPFASSVDWKELKEIYNEIISISSDTTSVSINKQQQLTETLNTIKNYIHKNTKVTSPSIADTLLQCIRNIRSQYCMSYYYAQTSHFTTDPEAILAVSNIRDKQMAENIIWYMKKYPDKKAVIWCANFHGAKDISQAETIGGDPTLPERYKTMGEYLAEEFGENLYSIAFTSPSADPGQYDFESEATSGGSGFGYIDFVPLRYDKRFFDQAFMANPIGYKSGKWMHMFDGMYIIKEQKRSTPLKQHPN